MKKLKVLDLFAGAGGMSLGLHRAGYTTAAFCEIDESASRVIHARYPDVEKFNDITTADFTRIGTVGLVAAGFPCQDISLAGKGAGLAGSRSGLFWEVLRAVRMVGRPKLLLENVAALLNRGMCSVLGALATAGYDAQWNCFPAAAIGSPHSRDRVWIVANPVEAGQQRPIVKWDALSSGIGKKITITGDLGAVCGPQWAGSVEGIRLGDGIPRRLVRSGIEQAGNAVVPQIPEMIGRAILEAEAAT